MRTIGEKGSRVKRGNRGFTLAELALAMTVLMVALMSISAATLRTHTLRRQNQERSLAQNAVRGFSERIQAIAWQNSADPDTWAGNVIAELNPGGSIGNQFNVNGLNPTNAAGTVGTITVLTDETQTDAALGFELGMPRDLNGDGLADNADISLPLTVPPPRLLPIVITVQWTGVTGPTRIDHPFFVMGY